MDAEQVEHASDGVIDQVEDRARVRVKGRQRRGDDGAHAREAQHVAQVDLVER
jgi:hypothetical protein